MMKSPCEGAAQVGYTKDVRAIWRRGKERPFIVVYDARLNPHILPVRVKDIARKCNPPIPYKP